MNKKLFLVTLMVALLACLFVINISAAGFESSFTTEVTELGTGPDWADLSDKNATAVLKKADETYVRIPLYYIYQANGSNQLRHEIQTASGRTGFRYDWITEKLGEGITHANLVALDIPEGIATTSGLNNYTSLKEVVFPLTATGLPMSENHPTLEKVFVKQSKEADGTIKGVTAVSDYAFKNVPTLEYFKFELDYATYIGSNAFMNCAVKELYFEGPMTSMGGSSFGGCAMLETIYINNTSGTIVNGGQMFSNNKMLRDVVLNGIALKDYAFQNANGLTEGGLTIVATNVGAVGYMPFKNMTNLTSVVLSDVTSLGDSVFNNGTNLKTVEISGPITSIGKSIFGGCNNIESAIIKVIGDTFANETSVGGITSIVSKDTYKSNETAYATGKHIVYGYTVCELTYGGNHDVEEKYVFKAFDKDTYKAGVCSRCFEEHITESYGPLIVINGFSSSSNGIMYDYTVNKTAVEKYIENGKTVSFGVVVAIGDVTAPLNSDGTLAQGVPGYASDLTARGNDLYQIAIKGIPAEHLATSLVCCGYITDGTTLQYMGATSLEETSTPVTLEALIALTPAETKEEY